MQRHYFIRDRRIDVEEVDNLAAVRMIRDERGQAQADLSTYGEPAAALADAGPAADSAQAAFERAGWAFVTPGEALREALSGAIGAAAADGLEHAEEVGKVVLRADGAPAVVTDLLNVQIDPQLAEAEAEAILAERGLTIVNRLKFAPNLYETRAEAFEDAIAASVALHDDPRFVFAEPSLIEHIPGRATPTDPNFGDQWQWSNTGANGGTAGADVSAEAAWDHTFGAGVRVAVIDNGFDAGHEDLAAGVSGSSGFFSNAIGGAVFTQGVAGMPGGNHGTLCAGMVGARRNNGRGGVGAAPDCELVLIACLGDQVGTQTTLARAVAYAINPANEVAGADPANGPDILVSSVGPNIAQWLLTATLDLALNAAPNGRQGLGLPIFWAASNGNNVDVGLDGVVSHANVIAVVRSNRNDLEDNAARGAEVELIAPGVDVFSTRSGNQYGTATGTSFAAPCAAGCAALALSVNRGLTGAELRQIMHDTADQIGGVVYDAAGHNDDYGFGRVNAERAVLAAARRIALLTPTITFNDVPAGDLAVRAIAWQCFGFEPLAFELVTGPTAPFGLLMGGSVTISAPGVGIGAKAQLWLTYTGTSAGDLAAGTVAVRCVQTGEEWTISINANVIAAPTVAVALVLDRSGSMLADAGDGRQRFKVLREAAQMFIDVAKPLVGVGIAQFDHDAQSAMAVTELGDDPSVQGRFQATTAISGHTPNPAGMTSIGDGVEVGATLLNAVAGNYDSKAMIVLTDGQENATKTISQVSGMVDGSVFAIGLGEPSDINPAKLAELTNGTGGYVAVTGNISTDEYYTLAKYYLQILAGVSNEQVVLDPDGYLQPTQSIDIPFHLTLFDSAVDVILLSPAPQVFEFELVTPSGTVIRPSAPPAGARFIAGDNVAYYRFTLPVVEPGGAAAGPGQWLARLACDRGRFGQWFERLDQKAQASARQGLRYALEIHARSAIKMDAAVRQKGTDVDDSMQLVVRLTEAGLPIEGRAEVMAELSGPTGPGTIPLAESEPGLFRAEVSGSKEGLYTFRLVAAGTSLRGERFTREQRLTGAIYVPRPPKAEGEPCDPDGGDRPPGGCLLVIHQAIARLLAKIFGRLP